MYQGSRKSEDEAQNEILHNILNLISNKEEMGSLKCG